MTKKLITLLLALLLAFSLTACNGGIPVGSPEHTSALMTAEVKSDVTQAPGDSVKPTAEPTEEPTAEPTETPTAADYSSITVNETVLVDKKGVRISAKGLSNDGVFGPELKLLIENTSGKDLTVQCRNSSVNGYMVETLMSVDVANGKKANDSLTFMRSELLSCGIEAIADMEFSFHIFGTDDWNTYFDTEKIQLKTSVADTYTYEYDDSGKVIYDKNGIRIIAKGFSADASVLGPGVVVYIENNTKKDITVQTRDESVNGFMVGTYFSCEVCAGKRAVDCIVFSSTELDENDIENFETVEFSFHIFKTADWNTIDDSKPVVLNFN